MFLAHPRNRTGTAQHSAFLIPIIDVCKSPAQAYWYAFETRDRHTRSGLPDALPPDSRETCASASSLGRTSTNATTTPTRCGRATTWLRDLAGDYIYAETYSALGDGRAVSTTRSQAHPLPFDPRGLHAAGLTALRSLYRSDASLRGGTRLSPVVREVGRPRGGRTTTPKTLGQRRPPRADERARFFPPRRDAAYQRLRGIGVPAWALADLPHAAARTHRRLTILTSGSTADNHVGDSSRARAPAGPAAL